MEISLIGFYHIKADQIEKRKPANLADCLYERVDVLTEQKCASSSFP